MSGRILSEPVIIVQQVWRRGHWPDYDLFDQNWAALGTARRSRPGGWRRVVRAFESSAFPGSIHVVETDGTLVLDILFASEWGQVILVRDAGLNLIGKGIRTKSGTKPQFDLDIGGQFVGALEIADWR